jgi:hypothetical protein
MSVDRQHPPPPPDIPPGSSPSGGRRGIAIHRSGTRQLTPASSTCPLHSRRTGPFDSEPPGGTASDPARDTDTSRPTTDAAPSTIASVVDHCTGRVLLEVRLASDIGVISCTADELVSVSKWVPRRLATSGCHPGRLARPYWLDRRPGLRRLGSLFSPGRYEVDYGSPRGTDTSASRRPPVPMRGRGRRRLRLRRLTRSRLRL